MNTRSLLTLGQSLNNFSSSKDIMVSLISDAIPGNLLTSKTVRDTFPSLCTVGYATILLFAIRIKGPVARFTQRKTSWI